MCKKMQSLIIRCFGRTLTAAVLLLGTSTARAQDGSYARYTEPPVFSYQELVAMEEQEPLPANLAQKLQTLRTTPYVSNEAYYAGARPRPLEIPQLGPSLRVVMWNIERGLQLDMIKAVLSDKAAFLREVKLHPNPKGDLVKDTDPAERQALLKRIEEQIDVLQSADVLILNECDWGMKRTEYVAVVKELGRALNMNWAYGVEFVEVDPKVLGIESFKDVDDPKERAEMEAEFSVDQTRLQALHGSAILSRYPFRDVTLRPFEHQGYDWYKSEKTYGALEKGKRIGSGVILGEKLFREIRRGGRTTLIATLDVPDLPGGRLTIAATHLENRAKPKSRRTQMRELLTVLAAHHNPVVIAGDLNTTGADGSNASVKNAVLKRAGSSSYWATKAIKYASGVGLGYDLLKFGFSSAKLQADPTAKGIKLFAPGKEQPMFGDLKKFVFKDGMSIDFRGDAKRTSNGRKGTLANSNQRARRGFVSTFELPRTLGSIGTFKLDWMLVKAYAKSDSRVRSYRFAPHFARSMNEVNDVLEERLSDHAPISVDLPFQEPVQLQKQRH